MPRTTGFVRSRNGWQRLSPIGIALAVFALAVCGGCGASPRRLYRDAESLRRGDGIEEALKVTESGMAVSRSQPDWFHRFRILRAELLVLDGLPKDALSLLDSTPGIAVPEVPEIKAGYLYVRGYALSQSGRNDEARPLLETAQQVAASSHLAPLESTVLVRLGTVLLALGNSAQTEKCYSLALALANASGDDYLRARAQEALGYLHLRTFHNDECAIWSGRALRTYQKFHAEIRQALLSVNLGWCDYRLGDHDAAQQLFANAETLFTKHKQWDKLGINLNATGAAAVARGDFPAARSDYERVVNLAGKTGDVQTLAYGLTNLATVMVLMGDVAGAEAANLQAQQLPQDKVAYETRLIIMLNAARISAARGRMAEAEATAREVASAKVRQFRLLIDADVWLAKLLQQEAHPQAAELALQHALAVLDQARNELLRDESKLTYSDALIEVFRDYVQLLCEQNRFNEALDIAESSRARLLSERSNNGQPLKSGALLELARKTGTVFLFYWIAPIQSHLWAIAPSGIKHYQLPALDDIRSLTRQYRAYIDDLGDPLSGESPGRKLYTELLGPVQPLLPAETRVVIVPDGPLFDINFEALPVPVSTPHYWLADATVSVAPSLSVLAQPRTARAPRQSRMLLIGDPLNTGEKDFPRLANAGKEIDEIRTQFPAGASVVRTGADATPQAYSAANPIDFGFIHFAAHATANQESPLDSAVVLTAKDGNNKLYARDIRDRPIDADLVTLSACRGAGARTYDGEGLVGFAWAFLGAGARNVIAGLWEVDDRSTAQLMQKMYGALGRKASPAAALREAKLALANSNTSFRKPYYWAPFQLFTVSPQ
jgi:CHAT domain-containing protein/tetratricopeptide (TPR) repeat protein